MALTSSEIDRIASLARLALSPQEAQQIERRINSFFEIVEKMQSVPTQDVSPMAHPTDAAPPEMLQPMTLRLRADQVEEHGACETNAHNAPSFERGLFLVPRVIE